MFKRETLAENPACPDCGVKLLPERDLLLCKEHGAFFAYGPQLVVRAPNGTGKPADALLPWENQRARTR